ncbi:glycoside hydrolase family 2 protein [Flavobacterium jejuense]|uniref:Beta-mannosidase B n=1 Tax=Flavobacterium jejuense TaxID=1544455 RepID=A0ABX0IY05_9FLAO|nr:glycoside hydrolase family 2 protein [Flavobacterium jejuense]NHN27627.1 glycoside hydrolase family 2 protein [Flavobacterium jejuense]
MLKFLFICLFPMLLLSQNVVRSLNHENWKFKQENKENWLPANVPGTVHTDLLANNLIKNPFYGTNEKELQWIENENWNYKTSFTITKSEITNQNIDLQLDGLDTYAIVSLNRKQILEVNNMFRTWKIPIKNYLVEGENQIEIKFKSAVVEGKKQAEKLPYTLPPDERIFTRKAQYQFGWDWGPRFVTAGIWKDVKLNFWNDITLVNVKYNQLELTKQKAVLEIITEIKAAKSRKIALKINDAITVLDIKKGINRILTPYEIKNPKFWWTNGLGEAHLYPFEISLVDDKVTIETKEINIGLRTIELVQDKDAIGASFYFKVNGVPVFMKGANYIPDDSFLPRVTDSIYKVRVKDAVDANMNMLRVWGGGIYGSDAFYDECDKNGILVWQDFMFACAMYPGDEGYLGNVKQEIIDNVNRLQNHPSLAIWCGNNENNEAWHNWGWQKQYKYSNTDSTKIWNDYERLFHQLIPKTLDSLLSKEKNIYWPSSPSIGWGRKESMLQGDSHYWGVWWGKEPFEMYEKKVGRFMSEYGFQGMPNLQTFKSFTASEDLNLKSETVRLHQKHLVGYETIEEYMKREYEIPKAFEDYIYVSQLLQVNGMKIAIEAHRRAKPNCMGTLFWQLNDCWPVTSWSSVDFYGNWKAFQYQAKKSFENLLISVVDEGDSYKIYIVNDNLKNFRGKLTIKTIHFNGKVVSESSLDKEVEANSSKVYYSLPKVAINKKNLKKSLLSVAFISNEKKVVTHFFWVKPKRLALTKPIVKIRHIDNLTIEISSDVLAKNVYLSTNENTHFSDNYFDVLPSQVYRITLSKPSENIMVKTLFDILN